MLVNRTLQDQSITITEVQSKIFNYYGETFHLKCLQWSWLRFVVTSTLFQ